MFPNHCEAGVSVVSDVEMPNLWLSSSLGLLLYCFRVSTTPGNLLEFCKSYSKKSIMN